MTNSVEGKFPGSVAAPPPIHRYYVIVLPLQHIKALCERIESEGQEVFSISSTILPDGSGNAASLMVIVARALFNSPLSIIEIDANEKAASRIILPR